MTNAHPLTIQLGGKWHGHYGTAPCPVCQPDQRREQNALTLKDGKATILAHCKKSACGFRDIMAAAGVLPGDFRPPDPAELARRQHRERAAAEKRAWQARRIWQEAQRIRGTVAEHYLRHARGITAPLPGTLRYHPEAWHSASAQRFPAMIARVTGSSGFAVHRTYLRPDGLGKADIDGPPKMMLGATAGGAVRLVGGIERLVLAEGIETALSLASGLLEQPASVWAALSAAGLRAVHLPVQPAHLVVAPDGDDAGQTAALSLAKRAHAQGWTVSFLTPPEGGDFNDILTGKAVAK